MSIEQRFDNKTIFIEMKNAKILKLYNDMSQDIKIITNSCSENSYVVYK